MEPLNNVPAARPLTMQEFRQLIEQFTASPKPAPAPVSAPPAPVANPAPAVAPRPAAAPPPAATPEPAVPTTPAAPAKPTPPATPTAPAPTTPAPASTTDKKPAPADDKDPPSGLPTTSKLGQHTYVVHGATLQCNKGSASASLRVVAKRPDVGGKPGANITDNAALANIPPFGNCKLKKNNPCVPAPLGWEGYASTSQVGGAPALLDVCTNQCAVGGKITITDPGQTRPLRPLDLIPAPPLTKDSWTCGPTPEGPVAPRQLKAMPNITPGGPPMFKSNNPETYTSNGVLASHDGNNSRGVMGDMKLKESVSFISHQNRTAGASTVWLIARNPSQTEPVTVSIKGSALTTADKRTYTDKGQITPTPDHADMKGRKETNYTAYTGHSPYYMVAEDLAQDKTPVKFDGVIPPGGAVALYKARLNVGGGVEGVLPMKTSGGEGVYTYVVATAADTPAEALKLATAPTKKMATGNIKPQLYKAGPNKDKFAFGTEAGVYAASKFTGEVPVDLPECNAFMALSINDSAYNPKADSPRIQSVPGLLDEKGESLAFDDSSQRTHANYGHEYDLSFVLRNDNPEPRKVRVWFSHTGAWVDPANPKKAHPQLYFNGAIRFNGEPPVKVLITYYKSSQELTKAPIVVGPGQQVRVPLRFFPPGMSSGGTQIKLQSVR